MDGVMLHRLVMMVLLLIPDVKRLTRGVNQQESVGLIWFLSAIRMPGWFRPDIEQFSHSEPFQKSSVRGYLGHA